MSVVSPSSDLITCDSRKRCERASPVASPMKLTQSPQSKKKDRRRERTETEGTRTELTANLLIFQNQHYTSGAIHS